MPDRPGSLSLGEQRMPALEHAARLVARAWLESLDGTDVQNRWCRGTSGPSPGTTASSRWS